MKKLSVQKLSLLGLVLMGASAVTAAILPSQNKSTAVYEHPGTLVESNNGAGQDDALNPFTHATAKTCVTASGAANCNNTTSGVAANSGSTMYGHTSASTTIE